MEKYTDLFNKAISGETISVAEGLELYDHAPTEELMMAANLIRQKLNPGNEAGWIIDRNVNITNVCFSQCSFCNFCRKKSSQEAYVTTISQYIEKIDELFALGGDQILLQGGMNPELSLSFYCDLFSTLKSLYPALRLHALGPPEIVYLAKKERLAYKEVLSSLVASGLDSLPGAGAEILSDRVRKVVSPGKATVREWLDVMNEAHILNLPTSATMMFGHLETREERLQHLAYLRELQEEKPAGNYGFIAFIPWPFQDKGTLLAEQLGIKNNVNGPEYIRSIAISRIMLNNIQNIQSSILTVGKEIAMLSLHAGANDLGSVMIEENVVSAAGAGYRFDASEMQTIIREAGFIPRRRNQKYETVK
jgi:cyclic dehypoxanthinyl futalosine synthase